MGYLISAHIVPEERDFQALNRLPQSFGYTVYFHEGARVFLLDLYAASRPPKYPFCGLLPSAEVPLDLPAELDTLNQLHRVLAQLKCANGLKRSYVAVALMVSEWLSTPVLSFVSDDDQLDFACVARDGNLSRLRCRCEDLLATYTSDGLVIDPMFSEDELDADLLTDVSVLQSSLPSAVVRRRTTPMPTTLHSIASREVAEFTGITPPILGLGSFEPPENERQWRKILQR